MKPEQSLNILALDSAMNGCGVGVSAGREIITERRAMPYGQAEHLIPMAQACMERARLGFATLDAILITNGPGAFTGLRIGMSAARGFALALDIPVFGITTLQVLALEYVEKEKPENGFTVLIETKRADFYGQDFDRAGKALGDPYTKMANDIDPSGVLIGDGVERFSGSQSAYVLPNPETMVLAFFQHSNFFTENPAPLYLRPPDVSAPKKEQRVLRER